MKKVLLLYIILFHFFGFKLSAQGSAIDSLENLLDQHSQNDTLRINLLNELAKASISVDTAKALIATNEALEIAELINNDNGKASSFFIKGSYYHRMGNLPLSIKLFQQSAIIYGKIGNKEKEVNCHYNLGLLNAYLNKYPESIKEFNEAIKLSQELNNKRKTANIYGNLGLIYQYSGQLEKAVSCQFKSLEIGEEINYTNPNTYINIGLIYNELDRFDESIRYYNKALKLFTETSNMHYMAQCIKAIGDAYLAQHKFTLATSQFNKAFDIYKEVGDVVGIARHYMMLGIIHQEQGDLNRASLKFKKALNELPANENQRLLFAIYSNLSELNLILIDSLNNTALIKQTIEYGIEMNTIATEMGSLSMQNESYGILYKVYTQNDNSKLALRYTQKFMETKDSLFSEIKQHTITEIHTKYETEKKELEIESQKKELRQKEFTLTRERLVRNGLIIGFCILLALVLFIFRLNKQKQKANQILTKQKSEIKIKDQEKEVLLKEIHHRVKNNLQIIWSLLDLQAHGISDEKIKVAINDGKNRVNSMAMIHTMLYQNEDAGNISFSEYLEKLTTHIKSTYTNMEKADVKIQIPSDLKFDIDTSIPLGLIVTELFTNALKYGVKDIEKGVVLLSVSSKDNNQYEMIISDNGPGLPLDFDPKKSTSLGLMLVPNLCRQVNGTFEMNNNNGAEFIIRFKGKSFTIA